MLSIISPIRDTSNEKPRFICEKFARREPDKRKKNYRIRSNFIVD